MNTSYRKIAQLRTVDDLKSRLVELNIDFPCDPEILSAEQGSPMAQTLRIGKLTVGNRWCIHPMEGWDANPDGSPSSWTLRRWQRFGESGAKLIWGGEAAAVRPDGRANPNQTLALASNKDGLERLRQTLVTAHVATTGDDSGLVLGLQLTHSGRFCRPRDKQRFEPRIAYHHPLLDVRFGIRPEDDSVVWTDSQLDDLVGDYVRAAELAQECGYHFVDIKACHGYLLHEFLSAHTRPGKYGGDYVGRTRLLRTIIHEVRRVCPELLIGVRLSLFDSLPYEGGQEPGHPAAWDADAPYVAAFGCNPDNPIEFDLSEPLLLIGDLVAEGMTLLNLTAGSPYYTPHLQRPAIFPPSDGYLPPEDPLVGVARHINVTATCKQHFPDLAIVGSGYTYLQDYLPHVAQATVRSGMVDAVGLGRMVLSYPQLPHDTLSGRPWQRKMVCRTFSECTTAPRNGLISGCYPLDEAYKQLPERQQLIQIKKRMESR